MYDQVTMLTKPTVILINHVATSQAPAYHLSTECVRPHPATSRRALKQISAPHRNLPQPNPIRIPQVASVSVMPHCLQGLGDISSQGSHLIAPHNT